MIRWKAVVQVTCWSLMLLVKRFFNSKAFVEAETVGRQLSTYSASTISSIHMHLGEIMSSRTRFLFSSIIHVMWSMLDCLVQSWVLNLTPMTGIEKHCLFLTVTRLWICRRQKTIDHVIVETVEPFHQIFLIAER